MKKPNKTIKVSKYNKKMDEIIKNGKPVSDTLFDMLNFASQHTLVDDEGNKV